MLRKFFSSQDGRRSAIGGAFLSALAVLPASGASANDELLRGVIGFGSAILQNELNRRSEQGNAARVQPSVGARRGEPMLSPDQIYALQMRLNALGFETGTPDGGLGSNTRRGIRHWQSSKGVATTGYLTQDQASELLAGADAAVQSAAGQENVLLPSEVQRFQQRLNELGYDVGRPDGVSGPRTGRAIARFLSDRDHDPYQISLRAAYELAVDGRDPATWAAASGHARSIFGGEAIDASAPGAADYVAAVEPIDPADYPLTGRGSPINIDHEIAFRALATMPELADNAEFVRKLFESEHPSPMYSSRGDRTPRSLKYWEGTQFDRQDVLDEYAGELVSKAETAPLKVTLTEELLLNGGYREGAGYPVRFGLGNDLSEAEYRLHNQLLSDNILMILPNAPVIDLIPAATPDDARRLADALADLQNSERLTLRLFLTINKVGPDRPAGRDGDIAADARLDGLAVYGYSRSRKEQVELYRWDVAPRQSVAQGGLDLAEAAAFFNLPMADGRLAVLEPSLDREESRSWERLMQMARVGAHPEILVSDEVALAYAFRALTEGEKAELAQGAAVFQSHSGGIEVLNEFARARFYHRLREDYLHLILGRVPNLPFPVVELFEGFVGEYDFASQSFPLTARSVSNSSTTDYISPIPGAGSALAHFPSKLDLDPAKAEQLVGMLRGRRVHFAIYSQMSFQSYDANTASFSLEPERVSLFVDPGLTQHIADFELEPLMRRGPAPEDPAIVAARTDARSIYSKPVIPQHVLAALSRDYASSNSFFDAYVDTSRRYGDANEFDRHAVRAEVEREVLASLGNEAEEFWLGGEITLGEYDSAHQAFPIVSTSIMHMSSTIDSFTGSVEMAIYNPEALSTLPMTPDAARALVEQYPDRKFIIRLLVEPLGASWDGDNPRYPELKFVYRLKEAYVLNGNERDPSSVTEVIARLEAKKAPDIVEAANAKDTGATWKGSTGRTILNQDMVLGLAARKAASLDDRSSNWLLANRFLYEFEVKPSLASRFYADGARTPVRATRDHFIQPFRQWLDATPDALPEKMTLVWERGDLRSLGGSLVDSSLLRSQCHHLSSYPRQDAMPAGFASPEKSEVFETQVNEINNRNELDPLIVKPAYLEFRYSSATNCADRGFGGQAATLMLDEFDLRSDEGLPAIQIVVDSLPMPPSSSKGNLAEIDVTLSSVEFIDNGPGIPHVLVKTSFDEVRFLEWNRVDENAKPTLTHLGTIGRDDTTKATFAERIGALPDILGITAGQTLDEADAILRAHFDNPRVLDTSRGASRPNQSFQDARIFLRQDGLEYVALLKDPTPGNEDRIVGVARQMIAPTSALSPDALVASLRSKFGPEDLFKQHEASMSWGDNVYRIGRNNDSREETVCEVRPGNEIPTYWAMDGQETDHLAQFVPWNDVRDYSFFMWPQFYNFPTEGLEECGAYARVHIIPRSQTGMWMFVGDIGAYARGRAARDAAPAATATEEPKLDIKL
ncbi:DUF4852 domain-containing protein [Mesorhizobium sp. CAU 1741]|uniref:DUF4852 domain-containing protein n=1 Tax=Mesorhizobium sp. CAU 1741 TaxID=3140366 RepID=UPI00325A4963